MDRFILVKCQNHGDMSETSFRFPCKMAVFGTKKTGHISSHSRSIDLIPSQIDRFKRPFQERFGGSDPSRDPHPQRKRWSLPTSGGGGGCLTKTLKRAPDTAYLLIESHCRIHDKFPLRAVLERHQYSSNAKTKNNTEKNVSLAPSAQVLGHFY